MRDCENCKHQINKNGLKYCESWECKYTPKMTPARAIEILKEVTFLATDSQQKEIEEAIQMGIKALGDDK